jgi:hypothetical protein
MKTIAQQLNIKKFPFEIKDDNGKIIYCENSDGEWYRLEHNANYDLVYLEDHTGYWQKHKYDSNNNEIYYEDSNGNIKDHRAKPISEYTTEELTEIVVQTLTKILGKDNV